VTVAAALFMSLLWISKLSGPIWIKVLRCFLVPLMSCWHRADVKLRLLFGRYRVESGHHRLVMSISAFDPKADIRQCPDHRFLSVVEPYSEPPM
jgi:hypothetical protein